MQWKKLFMNSTFSEYQFKFHLPVYKCILLILIFLKLYKISHFSIQNNDLKFTLSMQIIHLCAFKHEFGNLRLFREGGGGNLK